MRRTGRRLTSTAALVLFGCSGAVPWEDSCGCAPAWVGFASELGNPPPWYVEMVEPVAVSTAVWKYLRTQPQPATLEAIRSMNATFRESCHRENVTIRCRVWLWDRPGELRGLEVQIPFDPASTSLDPEDVLTRVIEKDV